MAVTDLTGTKWLINENPTADNFYSAIHFVSNNTNYTSFHLADHEMIFYNATLVCNIDSGSYWVNEAYRTIEITGGNDVTDSTLISWLQANATQITEQSNTFSIGNLPIANMYFGTQQVKKVYLGNALVWEKEETGYTVTLNCGGGSSYTKGSVEVWDSTYEDRSSSNLIFSQNSIDLSAYPVTLTVKSGHCTISVETTGSFMGSYIRTSDFTVSDDLGMTKEFVVDKNGTIEFGATDWDD